MLIFNIRDEQEWKWVNNEYIISPCIALPYYFIHPHCGPIHPFNDFLVIDTVLTKAAHYFQPYSSGNER
jgi:hypothetical protein